MGRSQIPGMSLKYSLDQSNQDKDLEELRFSRTQSYFDKSRVLHWILIVIFGCVLFLMFHFRQAYIGNLELGKIAQNYVVAQIDFSFPDEEATTILRQEAIRGLGFIYQLDAEQIRDELLIFQKHLFKIEEGQFLEKDSSQELEKFFDNISHFLYESRFVDPTFYARLQKINSPLLKKYPFFSMQLDPNEKQKLPNSWITRALKEIENESKELEEFFTLLKETSWQFQEDQGLTHTAQDEIMQQIQPVQTRVRSGERIIDSGEQVTLRHLAIMKAMKEAINQKRNLAHLSTLFGSLLITLIFIGIVIVYIRENHKDLFLSNRKLALFFTTIIFGFFLAKVVELFLIKDPSRYIDLTQFPLFVPFVAIMIASLMSSRIATFASILTAVVLTMAIAVEPLPFLLINVITALVAILSCRRVKRRKEIFLIASKAWFAAIGVILAFDLYNNSFLNFGFLVDIFSTFIFMGLTAILIVGILPIFEFAFKILTDITLMELMDPSHHLVRRLTIEAPGTYQHSIVVGNLAEAGATAVGANGLFCRVAAQYHDIGKLVNPQYFTENQLGGVDMHQLLTSFESAQVIINHVSEGVILARKHGLPEQFIDIIKEHHGTTLVYYFYHKQIESVEDKTQINESDFRYSGPKPRSKESTILMIADSLEAASRSLDFFTEKSVSDLVESLVAQKAEDGQFDDSLLTFEELGIVKKIMVKLLLAASHPRIKYPPHHPGEEG